MAGSESPSTPLRTAPEVPQPAHSLALSSGAVFAAALLVQLLGVIGSIFLYKHIGITPTGQALIGTAQLFLLIGSSINGVGDLRLGTSYTYFLARGKAAVDNTATYLAVRTAMVAAAGAILFAIAPLELYHHTIASSPADLESLGIFLTLPILWSFSTVYNQMFIGARQFAQGAVPRPRGGGRPPPGADLRGRVLRPVARGDHGRLRDRRRGLGRATASRRSCRSCGRSPGSRPPTCSGSPGR